MATMRGFGFSFCAGGCEGQLCWFTVFIRSVSAGQGNLLLHVLARYRSRNSLGAPEFLGREWSALFYLVVEVSCPMYFFSSNLLTNGVLFFSSGLDPRKETWVRLQQGELKIRHKKFGISVSTV